MNYWHWGACDRVCVCVCLCMLLSKIHDTSKYQTFFPHIISFTHFPRFFATVIKFNSKICITLVSYKFGIKLSSWISSKEKKTKANELQCKRKKEMDWVLMDTINMNETAYDDFAICSKLPMKHYAQWLMQRRINGKTQ